MGCANSQPAPRTERQRLNPNSPQKPNSPQNQNPQNQQRQPQQQPPQQRNPQGQSQRKDLPKSGATTVIPVSSPISYFQPQKEEIILGSSYSEQHAAKQDFSNELFYKKLIEKTSNDLIDVSQNVTLLDGQDSIHREKLYQKQLKKAEKNMNFNTMKFLSLPEAALSPDGPLPLLSDTHSHTLENEMIQKLGHEVLMSLKRMTVKDRGDLVVPFSSVDF